MRRHRKLRGRKVKKQRRIILASVIVLSLMFSAGYAAFSTSIRINAKGNVKDYNAAWQLQKKVITSGDGLYKDNNRYVYKGFSPSNYIIFSNEVWRIMSVEEDETIKIIKEEKLETNMPFDQEGARDETLNSYCITANTNGCNVWGYVNGNYINGNKTGMVVENATLNKYLNNVYFNSLSDNNKILLSGAWNIGPTGIYNDTASLSDLDSMEKRYTYIGTIGLASATDYLKANNNINDCGNFNKHYNNVNICKNTNYLFKSDYDWWLLSPYPGETANTYRIRSNGHISSNEPTSNSHGVRPVLFLIKDIKLKGQGSENNPYTIS